MTRRPLPRLLTGGAQIERGREFAKSAAGNASDILQPLMTISRGMGRLAASSGRRWAATSKERRAPLAFLVGACLLVLSMIPFGLLIGFAAVIAAAAWVGRNPAESAEETDEAEPQQERLKLLYEGLVPYFSAPGDANPLFAPGGDLEAAFSEYEFDESNRLTRLRIRYPGYFKDGEPESRACVERLLYAKSGRGREYHFQWDEEGNQLDVTVLAALPMDVRAQRFVASAGESVLGFTDASSVHRTLPVHSAEGQRDASPVIWRTGTRSTAPHLLALGQPGTGTTTLLRSLALQALQFGEVIVVDGGGTGEYGFLAGRRGVLGVETRLTGTLGVLGWAAHETERRLSLDDAEEGAARRPIWILVDRPSVLSHLAVADGRTDPQELLRVPLRHGRAANVTVVVADQFDATESLSEAVKALTRARAILGPATAQQVEAVLGAPPNTTPTQEMPPGRGYARLGQGPVYRLQVPATPNPYDEEIQQELREAVLALLPERALASPAA